LAAAFFHAELRPLGFCWGRRDSRKGIIPGTIILGGDTHLTPAVIDAAFILNR
jgi:hypothetical protein